MSEHQGERWQAIPTWEGCYEVSDHGRVRSLPRRDARGRRWAGRIMAGSRDREGWYTRVILAFGKRREPRYVHRLVAETFIGPSPRGMEVNHIDGNKTNNHVSNLEYVTHVENSRHAARLGLVRSGLRHHGQKLTTFQVQMILLLNGHVGTIELARWFGVDPTTISAVRHGQTWTHVYRDAVKEVA